MPHLAVCALGAEPDLVVEFALANLLAGADYIVIVDNTDYEALAARVAGTPTRMSRLLEPLIVIDRVAVVDFDPHHMNEVVVLHAAKSNALVLPQGIIHEKP